jgi:hypothetical protein
MIRRLLRMVWSLKITLFFGFFLIFSSERVMHAFCYKQDGHNRPLTSEAKLYQNTGFLARYFSATSYRNILFEKIRTLSSSIMRPSCAGDTTCRDRRFGALALDRINLLLSSLILHSDSAVTLLSSPCDTMVKKLLDIATSAQYNRTVVSGLENLIKGK